MSVYVLLILGWLLSAPIVGTIVGRAISIADRRAAQMRYHPSIRELDFDRHAAEALDIVTADHRERAHFTSWEREMRGVQ